MLETIRGLDVADSVKQKILAGNASKLLGLRGGEIKANA
jgi:hypothetical protein